MPLALEWSREDVRTVVNRNFYSNTYLFKTGSADDCIVIDPGLDQVAISLAIDASHWRPVAVMCTHGHFDHVGTAAWLQSRYQIPVYMRPADLKLARMSNFMMSAFKLSQRIELPDFQEVLEDGGIVICGASTFVFHALPGHTPGSAGIAVNDLFFSGDSLYARKTALSSLPGEDHAVLRASLANLFTWIDGTVRVLPGHGSSATIDEIQHQNTELLAFLAGS